MPNPRALPPSLDLDRDVSLAGLNTMGIGGNARWFVDVTEPGQLPEALDWAEQERLPVFFLGDGSNVLFSDQGFPGLVIRNRIAGLVLADGEVEVNGGHNLAELIRKANSMGLAGLERLYGIPGTVAGAVVGNAGAYGQQIGDVVTQVTVYHSRPQILEAPKLEFGYRTSLLKRHPEWFVLSCRLRLSPDPRPLQEISEEILTRRLVKYPSGLRCPGSFFKNVTLDAISREALRKIPEDFIMFGKIPAGKLLEAVGANGAQRGGAQYADYHGNLIVNRGGACSQDVLWLADRYAGRVFQRFQIRLEPEIIIVSDGNRPQESRKEQT